MSSIELARQERARRGEELLEARVESILDSVGLSEKAVEALAVGPNARKKLSGILKRLASKKDPFTTCMADLREHRPELGVQAHKKICGRLKSMVKGTGKAKALSMDDGAAACVLVDADVSTLLMSIDEDKLAALIDDKEAS